MRHMSGLRDRGARLMFAIAAMAWDQMRGCDHWLPGSYLMRTRCVHQLIFSDQGSKQTGKERARCRNDGCRCCSPTPTQSFSPAGMIFCLPSAPTQSSPGFSASCTSQPSLYLVDTPGQVSLAEPVEVCAVPALHISNVTARH